MTTEIATTANDSAIDLLPPARQPSLAAREMLLAHAEMMQTAYGLADAMCRTKMVPLRFQGKTQDGVAAILYGAELGLNPIQALQRVVPIHGMPTLEARTMVALLKSRGYRVKTVAQCDESVTVRGVDVDGDEYESTWTIERARKAGYVPTPAGDDSLCRPEVDSDWVTVTKTWEGRAKTSVLGNMKYITDPQAMLKAKAQAEVCRDMAPQLLMGISYSREDLESERFDEGRSAPVPATRGAPPITVEEILNPTPTAAGAAEIKAAEIVAAAEETNNSEPPAAAGVPEGPATAAQNRQMHAVFRDIGLTDRQDRLIVCGEIVGIALKSSKELTESDADKILSTLSQWRNDKQTPIDTRLINVLQAWAARQADPAPAGLDTAEPEPPAP